MKNNLKHFIALFITGTCFVGFFTTIGNSQNYHKLIRTNTFWDCFRQDPVMCYSYINRIYFTGSDTLIGGIAYKKSLQYPFAVQVVPGPLCPPFVIDTSSIPTYKYMREDTIAKKVYIYDAVHTPHDQLLYDFSLQVGDTLHSKYNGIGSLYVTSIENVVLNNGEVRQEFIFNNSGGIENYIESIGGSQGLFDSLIFIPGFAGGYFCVTDNMVSQWGSSCNWYFVGINDPQPDDCIYISPNPAKSYLIIQLKKPLHNVECNLWNLSGQCIISQPLTAPETKLSLFNISPGLYELQFHFDEGNKVFRVIIK